MTAPFANIDVRERIERKCSISSWNNLLQSTFGEINVSASRINPFSASLREIKIGETSFYECHSTPASIAHEPVPSVGKSSFLIKAQISGRSILDYEGGRIELCPGDYVVCDGSRPFTLMFDEETNIISVPLSLQYLKSVTPFPEDICFVTVSEDCPLRRVVNSYLASIVKVDIAQISAAGRNQLVDTYFKLAILSILENTGNTAAQRCKTDGLFFRCCSEIRKLAGDEAVTVRDIAGACGISVRYLQEIFTERDLTVTDFLSNIRLEEARRLLAAGGHGSHSIGEIAYVVGFKSHAHFSRAFKTKYGCSPSALRSGG